MFSPNTTRRLIYLWLTAAFCLLFGSQPVSASILRWAPGNSSDQSKSIVIYADHITAWSDNGQKTFLVQGKVWMGQGLVNLRFDQGIIRLARIEQGRVHYYLLQIYAEGNVNAEEGAKDAKSNQAVFSLRTSESPRFKPADKQLVQRSLADEPLFGRALRTINTLGTGLPDAPEFVADAAPTNSAARKLPALGAPRSPQPERDTQAKSPAHNSIQLAGGIAPPPQVEQIPAPQGVVPTPPNVSKQVPPGAAPLIGGLAPRVDRPFFIRPRSSFIGLDIKTYPLQTGETAVVVNSGIMLTIQNADGQGGLLDIEADRLVFWTRGHPQQIIQDLQSNRNQDNRPMEFYLSGHVEIRTRLGVESRLLRADEVYYDVNRQVAVATCADLQIDDPFLKNPVHLASDEILQLNKNLYQARETAVNASVLPWDPGLALTVQDSTVETKDVTRRTIFGGPIIDHATGLPVQEKQRYFRGKNMFLYLHDVPIFYLPYVQGDVDDPLGPLENLGVNYNDIFGFQVYTTWDMYDLIGITSIPGTKWRLNLDYLSKRGPAAGTDFNFNGTDLFGYPNRYSGAIKAYGIHDTGVDIIGGNRGQVILTSPTTAVPVTHPDFRGRLTGRSQVQDLPGGFTVQKQISWLSDHNFLEQYYMLEYNNDLNQETFLYVKQQQGNWAWTGLVEPRIRDWVTETQWYPRLDGYLLGASIFDVVTYNARASAGYAELRVTEEPSFAYLTTDVNTDTARFDLWQEASIPIPLGPINLVPYGIVDLAYYSNDLTGQDRGRLYGALGMRANLPMSRLYRNVYSELFNLDGIYHKVNFSGNYYVAQTDTSFNQLPQLDRLNDDASDQALRDIRPNQPVLNPSNAVALASPLFDPQLYAVRRLVQNRIDTLDDVQVLQLGVQQRWQTKRGFTGREHIIDWMTLNLSGSVFPNSSRDNFGESLAFLEYDWTWNIGDRTSLVSTGWVDPIEDGPRVFTLGAQLNRPDESNLYLGYRQIDPLLSKAVIGAVNYRFSRKYSMTAAASYDFGVEQQVTSVLLTREGTDLRVSFGLTYNSILQNFGVIFEVMPNLFPTQLRAPGAGGGFLSPATTGR